MTYSLALEAFYEWNDNAILNRAEARIHHLYQFLLKGMKPWEWDYQNYSGDSRKESMIGFFYPEDTENIIQIEHYITIGHNRQVTATNAAHNK